MITPDSENLKYFIPLMILDAVLRGLAMWRSARAGKKWWFVALFIVNSLGILPAVYLFLNRKKASTSGEAAPANPAHNTPPAKKKSKL